MTPFRLPELLKWVGNFVALIGGAGAGFTGLAFGVGYLAIKSHDSMIGLPTVAPAQSSYMTVGSLFFYNSLYFLIEALSDLFKESFPVLITIGAVVLVPVGLLRLHQDDLKVSFPAFLPSLAFAATLSLLLGLAFASLQTELALLHPQNRDLLMRRSGETPEPAVAKKIHETLREPDLQKASKDLQQFYGQRIAVLLAILAAAVLVRKLLLPYSGAASRNAPDAAAGADRTPWMWTFGDWLLRPAVYSLLFLQALALPSAYGITCLPRTFPCVDISQTVTETENGESATKTVKKSGFLLSDLSVAEVPVVLLRKQKGGLYEVEMIERGPDLVIGLIRCEKNEVNILAK